MNLARREMALVLATLFSEYDLYREHKGLGTSWICTTRNAQEILISMSDYMEPAPANGSKGLRVVVRGPGRH